MNPYFVKEVIHYCNVTLDKCEGMPAKEINYYDLTFVLQGKMTYTVDGETLFLSKNDAIFLPPGTMRYRAPGRERVKYVSFNFYLFSDVALPFGKFMPDCISSDIKKMATAFPHSHMTPYCFTKEKVANILNYILLELLYYSEIQSKNQHIQKTIAYIEKHIMEKMSLQSISKEIGLTKEYTAFLFKKEMGRTVIDYINERKMLLAKELIIDSDMALTDLAFCLGYDNYHYFSRLFKRYFDITPSAFKKRR